MFFYDGLYRVTAYRYVLGDINDEEGKRGKKGKKPEKRCMVFQFFMQRLKGQPARKSGEVRSRAGLGALAGCGCCMAVAWLLHGRCRGVLQQGVLRLV